MADRVGQQVGNYRLIHLLGQGGFAEVYLGEHLRLQTRAAIKVLQTQLAGDEEIIPLPPEVCPPLVEKWQSLAAHQRMQANKKEAGKPDRSTKEALLRGGYILCGTCGRPMDCASRGGHAPHTAVVRYASIMMACHEAVKRQICTCRIRSLMI